MSFTDEQKSMLAKLMASENIRVEHRKIDTARFDPKNRVMYLPVWKEMTGTLYDLLTGHECGHALYTPAEGWHDAVTSKGMNYKGFLNVIEDARIEKKIQRKYPGLRASFREAYVDMMNRDFFGTKNRDLNELSFIDRLNLFTKSQYSLDIEFSDVEDEFVERAKTLETWEDVVRLTDDIFEYSKDEQKEEIVEESFDDFDDNDFDDSDEHESTEGGSDETWKTDAEDSKDDDSDPDGQDGYLERHKDSSPVEEGFSEPVCDTDRIFRNNQYQFLDAKSKEFVYIKFPKPNLKEIITPAKRVHESFTEFYSTYTVYDTMLGSYFTANEYGQKLVNEFKQNNERYINLLVKEFEMRKAAKSYDKRKVSETGDIDVGRLSSYKFDDNIFKKMMMIPKGKSHGLILLLDYSGSMSNNMAGSIEQILVLSMFCRKVGIPFAVYSFSNSASSYSIDKGKNWERDAFFSRDENELCLPGVVLREYLNSDMNSSEYTKCVRNMLLLKASYDENRNVFIGRPASESMSNTPLTEAIVAMAHIMKDFKLKKKLDITNLVIVHDGDADNIRTHMKESQEVMFDPRRQNVYFRDIKNGFEFQMPPDFDVMNVALMWFKKFTKSNVFGFFTVPYASEFRSLFNTKYYNVKGSYGRSLTDEDRKVYDEELKKEKFVTSYNPGYEHFYFIRGGSELKTDSDELVITGNITTNKLKTAFMKKNKKRQTNRVLVNKFIQGISV